VRTGLIKNHLAWLAALPLLSLWLGCNLILGTEQPLPLGSGGGGAGGSSSSSTSSSSTSASSTSSSSTASSTSSSTSSTSSSGAGGTGGGGGGDAGTKVCGDDGWAHWNPDAARTFTPGGANQYVVDSLTGLTWQAYSMASSPLSYADAQAYCQALSVDVLTSGWRLPTRVEMLSLIEFDKVSPALDPSFHNVYGAPYWSTSDYVDISPGPAQKWLVWLGDGATSSKNPATDTAWVRCVNGAPPDADPACKRYVLTNGTATDKETGLIWQRNAASGQKNRTDAKAACAAVTTEGHVWRLPGVEELATLIDEKPGNLMDPRFDGLAFPFMSEPNGYYWTATDFAASPADTGWNVGFYDGVLTTSHYTDAAFYRCVSGP
jgi:hypothetical protein